MRPINHFLAKPEVNLTGDIAAKELIAPGMEGGLSAHKIWMPANTEYPPHIHPSPHIIILLEGGGYLKYGQDENEVHHLINAGDVFDVPADTVHQVGADTRGLVMIAMSVGSKPLTDPDRLQIVQ